MSRDLSEICQRSLTDLYASVPEFQEREAPVMCIWISIENMTTRELTPAEVALHLGFELPMDANRSALATEPRVEAAWLGIP